MHKRSVASYRCPSQMGFSTRLSRRRWIAGYDTDEGQAIFLLRLTSSSGKNGSGAHGKESASNCLSRLPTSSYASQACFTTTLGFAAHTPEPHAAVHHHLGRDVYRMSSRHLGLGPAGTAGQHRRQQTSTAVLQHKPLGFATKGGQWAQGVH